MEQPGPVAEMIERARLQARLELALGLRDALLNPLAGLLGALQVLRSYPMPPDRAATVVAEAEREARRIAQIVRSVSMASRAPVLEIGPLRISNVAHASAGAPS